MVRITNNQQEENPDLERRERRKAYCKAYREANKERRKAWYQANKARIRKAARDLRTFLRQEQQENDIKLQA